MSGNQIFRRFFSKTFAAGSEKNLTVTGRNVRPVILSSGWLMILFATSKNRLSGEAAEAFWKCK